MRGFQRALLGAALGALAVMHGGLVPTAWAQEVSVPAYGEGPGASGIAASTCVEIAGPSGGPTGMAPVGVLGGPADECAAVEQLVVTQLPRTGGGAPEGAPVSAVALLGAGLVGFGCACRARDARRGRAAESPVDTGNRRG